MNGQRPHSRPHGFTLLELLVALAIVAILCGLAWPSYGPVMQQARRNEARLALLELQYALERHYLRHFAYTDQLETPAESGGLGRSAATSSGAYRLSVALREHGQGYVAEAVAHEQGPQSRDAACMRFTIDEKGVRSARDARGVETTAQCWR